MELHFYLKKECYDQLHSQEFYVPYKSLRW